MMKAQEKIQAEDLQEREKNSATGLERKISHKHEILDMSWL